MMRIGTVFLALSVLTGCSTRSKKIDCKALVPSPTSINQLPSTHSAVFLGNLESSIVTYQRVLTMEPGVPENCLKLSSALFRKAQYLGDANKLAAATNVLSTCAPNHDDAQFATTRAGQLQSLHKFAEARKQIDRALELGASMDSVRALQEELNWNVGKYDMVIPGIRERARTNPGVKSLARLALLEHAIGNYDKADVAFNKAEKKITDTNPLTIAWLYVQRGHHHMEIGEYILAESFFREAVKRLPQYVAATEHLGEVLALQGKLEESAVRYEQTMKLTDNPEFMGALAGVYDALDRKSDAERLRTKAREGFQKLSESFPDAMSWHAADFYIELGELDKASTLLENNLALRPTSEALLGMAKVQLAKENFVDAKHSIDKALLMPLLSMDLLETAALIESKLGNSTKSQAHKAKAMKLAKKIKIRFKGCPV